MIDYYPIKFKCDTYDWLMLDKAKYKINDWAIPNKTLM